nr:PREDICTED: uncharacterized protein LOC109030873 [Bemisia tabaci]
MRVKLLGFWIWCLLGTRFPSIAGEISSQLRGELKNLVSYDPCHRTGINRNTRDCRASVMKFIDIPENDRGPCKNIHTFACHSKFFGSDKCKVWVTGPGIPSKQEVTLSWCVQQFLNPSWEEAPKKKSSRKFGKKSSFRKQGSKRG